MDQGQDSKFGFKYDAVYRAINQIYHLDQVSKAEDRSQYKMSENFVSGIYNSDHKFFNYRIPGIIALINKKSTKVYDPNLLKSNYMNTCQYVAYKIGEQVETLGGSNDEKAG